MNIGIDIDDTISNTHDVLFSYAQMYTIKDLKRKIKEPKEKIMTGNGYCQRFHNWSKEETIHFFDVYYERILKEVTVKKFAKEIIHQLREQGNKIYLITARFERPTFDMKKVTRQWLEDNEIEYDDIIFDAQDKVEAVKNNNIEILIDDAVPNCKSVSEAGIKTYIMNSIENQGYEIPNVMRLYSWLHAEQELEKK